VKFYETVPGNMISLYPLSARNIHPVSTKQLLYSNV